MTCCILPLLCLGMFLISLFSLRPLSWRDLVFYWRTFWHLMRLSYGLFFFNLFMSWLHWQIFVYWTIPTSLDEADLIMVDDFSDVFLDSVCQYFIEYFCINVHEGVWSIILFLNKIFVWFGYQGNCTFQFAFFLWNVEQFENIHISSFFENLVESAVKPFGNGLFWLGDFWWLFLFLQRFSRRTYR